MFLGFGKYHRFGQAVNEDGWQSQCYGRSWIISCLWLMSDVHQGAVKIQAINRVGCTEEWIKKKKRRIERNA